MLQSGYMSVPGAKSRDEFRAELIRLTRQLGFETVSAVAVIDRPVGEPEFINIDNAPPAYRASYDNHEEAKHDPVMQHCKTSSLPIVWDEATYINAGLADKWEHQARFGYRCGIAFAMHMPRGAPLLDWRRS